LRMRDDTKRIILAAWEEIERYYGRITVRQLYYRLLQRGIIPPSDALHRGPQSPGYRKLIRILALSRRGEFDDHRYNLPPDCLADDTRPIIEQLCWRNLDEFLDKIKVLYRTDWWASQPRRIGVWVEKDALRASFQPICEYYGVPLIIGRGYSSLPLIYQVNRRFQPDDEILYFGDFDADGLWIEEASHREVKPTIVRIALTEEQKDSYPAIPIINVKKKDHRTARYVQVYGPRKWEIEAMPPQQLEELLRHSIESRCDLDRLNKEKEKDEEQRSKITTARRPTS